MGGRHIEDANINDFENILGQFSRIVVKDSLPKVLFWVYDDDNILPNSIKISEFTESPDSCIPLRNMFILAGHDNIKDDINKAKEGSYNQFQNFLNRVAKLTTMHFKKVWKDYRNIEFSLRASADEIIPAIKEINSYDFEKRSDGFKRFVTFLLLISINYETNNLSNTLLLIDDPDTGLHPTGERYLRDELIRISNKNYVVYSTHSIFMIDSLNIARHLIVQKNKHEVTNIEVAKDSNIADEEVLYNALGYTIYEMLKENNIIFEGWRDKKLFQVFIGHTNSDLKTKFKNVGICHAKGVKFIKTMTPFMELAQRKCLIISDNDTPAIDQQKAFKREKCYGEWKRYQEIDSSIEAITGEDFLENGYIADQINILIKDLNLPMFDNKFLPVRKGKLDAIFNWLKENGINNDQANTLIRQIKDSLFENLSFKNINDDYLKLIEGISKNYV